MANLRFAMLSISSSRTSHAALASRLAHAAMAMAMVIATPTQAQASDKTINEDQRAQGMKEAPAVVRSAGVRCIVTDAYFLGKSDQKNAAGFQASAYETACKEGMGYIVISAPAGSKAKAFDCLATASDARLACRLPANADPKQGLAPLLAAAGQSCTLKNARSVGRTPDGEAAYEVACKEGEGYVLKTSAAGAPVAIPCLQLPLHSGVIACTLTSRAQSVTSFSTVVAQSGKTCQVSDVRYLASVSFTESSVYEVACGSQPGFIVATDSKGASKSAMSCRVVVDGCVLNDAAAGRPR